MDAHHDIVMRARAARAGAPPVRYFAWSTILDRDALAQWRTQHGYADFALPPGRVAAALDTGLVFDFPSRWWGGRVAGLTPRPGATAWGLLFEIPGPDWPIVGHKEGAVTGMSVEAPVRVRIGDEGEIVEATTFVTNPARARTDGPVSERFVEAMLRGARDAGLPAAWLDAIREAAR